MQPNPNDYDVTPDELRKRMKLPTNATIIQSGVEHMFSQAITKMLVDQYDIPGLMVRTFPDFIVIINGQTILVEAKQKTTSLEAIGLLFNKQKEREGCTVLYSFPDITINASLIPMENIIIPPRYREKFDTYLKDLFVKEECEFCYAEYNPKNGSGDPYLTIDEEDLKMLAGGNELGH